jgi:hypothetical protein
MKLPFKLFVLAWAFLGVFIDACGGRPLQAADDGGGPDAYACAGLDQKTCLATVGCTGHLCAGCFNQTRKNFRAWLNGSTPGASTI